MTSSLHDNWPVEQPAPTQVKAKRPHLSHSAVKNYEQCGQRYRLERIDRREQAPSDALAVGVAVHAALEDWTRAMKQQWRGQRLHLPSLSDLVDRAYGALSEELHMRDKRGVFTPAEVTGMRERTRYTLGRFMQEVGIPWRRAQADGDAYVDGVEEAFWLPIVDPDTGQDTGYDFTGRIDVRRMVGIGPDAAHTGNYGAEIDDFKTAGKPWKRGIEHQDKQATAYAWAERERARAPHEPTTPGELPSAVVFHIVNLQLSPTEKSMPLTLGYERRATTRTEGDVRAYQRGLVRTLAHLQAGEYTPNPCALCAWCGVLHACETGQRWLAAQDRYTPTPVIARHMAAIRADKGEATGETLGETTGETGGTEGTQNDEATGSAGADSALPTD